MNIEFTPVGVSFSDTAPNIDLLKVGAEVDFEHKPAFYGTGDKRKEYPNAVVILFNGKKVGSLAESSSPESPQQSILRMLKDGQSPKGKVIELMIPKATDTFKKTYKLSVEVSEQEVVEKSTIESKISFNEGVVVEFDPVPHTYTVEGKKLTSATGYIKKFYKDFDVERLSSASANSWGVEQSEVKELWDSNKKLAQQLGTLVHNSIEHYIKFKDLGAKISEKKGLDYNYALPKHPVIRSIIEGFIKIDKSKGKVYPEALLTSVEDGLCGHADLIDVIDADKKICRVGDFKVNVNSEEIDSRNKALAPFDYLPANKLSKYQLQMSFYANLLQKSGWTVEGLDVYVYENSWLHYNLQVLKVI